MIFENKERKGIILLIIIIFSFFIFKNYKAITTSEKVIYNESIVLSATPINDFFDSKSKQKQNKYKKSDKNLLIKKHNKKHRINITFDFDPNAITFDSILLLGFNKRVANNWTKYIKKGGKFKTKTDLKRIYGLSEKKYESIKNHIKLPNKQQHKFKSFSSNQNKYIAKNLNEKYKHKKHNKDKILKIEINSCDTSELKKLYGIGTKLSARIIKFRNKLGGFHSINQLKEVYGLSKETFLSIKPNLILKNPNIKKFKINTIDKKTLNKFPYISHKLANQIIKYRIQHGDFKNLDDLSKIITIDSTRLRKIKPYIDYASS